MKQVLEKGPALKMFKEAHRLFTHGHEDQALSRYIYLAAQGFEVANFNAAFILENSKDPKNFERVLFFYTRSAKFDNPEARKKVGDAYYKIGDVVAAVAHYIEASRLESPDPEALFNLGYAYENGIGLKKDLWSALDMYASSLARGKSGKLAVSLAITKVRFKIFLQRLNNLKASSQNYNLKGKKLSIKSRRDFENFKTLFLTIFLSSFIYFYFNHYLPRQQQQRQNNENEGSVNNDQYQSIHSDSSSSVEILKNDNETKNENYLSLERMSEFSLNEKDADEDEVD